MSFFTKLRLGVKKELYVSKIPQDMLTMKSSNVINGFVTLYYLNKGKTLLTVLNDENNDVLEIIRKLDTFDGYFHLPFDNLIINKNTNKLLAFSYPFEPLMLNLKDASSVKKVISEDNQITYTNLNDYSCNDNEGELKSKLVKVLFIYKVLMYLNKNDISVKELTLSDISRGSLDENIYSINALSKLKLLKGNEESHIVELCVSYLKSQDVEERLGNDFKEYIKEFENDNTLCNLFEEKLNTQIEHITKFYCGHEWNDSFFRCPICNNKDVIITIDEQQRVTNSRSKFSDENFNLYSKKTLDCENDFILFKSSVTQESKNTIIEYVKSQSFDQNYGIIYDEKCNFIGLQILIESQKCTYKSVKKFMDNISKNNDFPKNSRILEFCCIFKVIYNEIEELINNNFYIQKDEDLLNSFVIVDGDSSLLFVKPTCIVKNNGNIPFKYDNLMKTFFEYFKEKYDNNQYNVLELIDPIIYIEYNNYINNNLFDAHRAYERLVSICTNEPLISHLEKYGYSECYKVSPLFFKTNIVKENSELILSEYEMVQEDIKINNIEEVNVKNCDIIYPEQVIYKEEYSDIKYLGYVIKKTDGILLTEAFDDIGKYDNKTYIKMLTVYLDLLEKKGEYPVSYAYFTKDLSKIFFKYNNRNFNSEIDYISTKKFLINIVEKLEKSNIYMSDALEIISDIDNLKTKFVKNKLNRLFNSLTNYCEYHKTWYEKNLKRCPICSKYYLYLDSKYLKNSNIIYENELCILKEYKKSRIIKLFKEQDGKLVNGKSIEKIEKEILDELSSNFNNKSYYLKLIKDDTTEKTVGIIVKNISMISLKSILDKSDNTNITYLGIAKKLLESFEEICIGFNELNNMSIDEFFSDKLCYASKKVVFFDFELYERSNTEQIFSKENYSILDKMIRYILSYNNKCNEFKCIEYPKLDKDYIYNMSSIILELKEHLDTLCPIHNVYYNPQYGICPLCAEENPNELIIESNDELGKKTGYGGESNIYKFGLRNLVKVYKGEMVDKNASPEIIEANLNNIKVRIKRREETVKLLQKLYKATSSDLLQKDFGFVFAKKSVYRKRGDVVGFIGYMQEKIKSPMSFISFTNTAMCDELGFERNDLLKILINFGEAIEYLHNSTIVRNIVPEGIVVGDINGRNALYSKYENKIYLIDMDGIGTNKYPCNDTCTVRFADPIVRAKKYPNNYATFDSDWYSYAILCFFVLTKVHPFDGVYQKSDGTKMEVPERMQKRISVLGRKKVVLSNVVISWDWMSDKLVKAFIDIFENDKRFSILPLLKEEYNILVGTNSYITQEVEDYEAKKVILEKLPQEKKVVKHNLKVNELAIMNESTLECYSSTLSVINDKVYYNNYLICDKFLNTNVCGKEQIEVHLKVKEIAEQYIKNENGIFTAIDNNNYKYIFRLKNGISKAIYRMSSSKREFSILHDELNDIYLLLAYDDVKSYIVINEKVAKINEIYGVVNFERYTDLFNYISNHETSKLCYVGNVIYYLLDGQICRINLVDESERKVACDIAQKGGFIKFIDNKFIIGSKKGIFEITQ